jgi:tRNA pseudouridine32 synthase/23S rRNA pseudouridine746 synthase
MLEGVPMDENPLLEKPAERRWISILYEDNDLLVIVKPAELLSVPGKINQDSVYTQIREIRPNIQALLLCTDSTNPHRE